MAQWLLINIFSVREVLEIVPLEWLSDNNSCNVCLCVYGYYVYSYMRIREFLLVGHQICFGRNNGISGKIILYSALELEESPVICEIEIDFAMNST